MRWKSKWDTICMEPQWKTWWYVWLLYQVSTKSTQSYCTSLVRLRRDSRESPNWKLQSGEIRSIIGSVLKCVQWVYLQILELTNVVWGMLRHVGLRLHQDRIYIVPLWEGFAKQGRWELEELYPRMRNTPLSTVDEGQDWCNLLTEALRLWVTMLKE